MSATEEFCTVGEVTLCYESFGDPADPVALLIMGLGTQMLGWPDDFCRALAGRGLRVVRFDNRDVGRSSRCEDAATAPLWRLALRRVRAGYTLADMAEDAVGLLDHLGAERAHVIGASMGGMIAQTVAARHPDRTASLTSIMSNTGHRLRGQPKVRMYPVLLGVAPAEQDAYVEHSVRTFTRIGSPGFVRDEAALRDVAARSWARAHGGLGAARQLVAIVAAGDRTARLRGITAPTLVIHGTRDRLVRPSGGRATARAIPGARLLLIEGMGHDLPRGAWPRILDAIEANVARADAPAAAPPAGA